MIHVLEVALGGLQPLPGPETMGMARAEAFDRVREGHKSAGGGGF